MFNSLLEPTISDLSYQAYKPDWEDIYSNPPIHCFNEEEEDIDEDTEHEAVKESKCCTI